VKLGAGAKVFFVSVLLIAVTVVGADLVLERGVTMHMTELARQDLYVRSKLVARELTDLEAPLDDANTWHTAAVNLANVSESRVTVIRKDGVVVADSEETLEGTAKMENHLSRPEVSEALATGRGEDIRESKTIKVNLIYVAVPVTQKGQTAAVVRCSVPLSIIERATNQIEGFLFIGSALALLMAMLLSVLVRRAASAQAPPAPRPGPPGPPSPYVAR